MTQPYEQWRRERMCGQKVAYASRLLADNRATVYGWRGWPAHSYQCPYCGQYHLASEQEAS